MAKEKTVEKELKKQIKSVGRYVWASRNGYSYDYAYRLETGRLPITVNVASTIGYVRNRKGEWSKYK